MSLDSAAEEALLFSATAVAFAAALSNDAPACSAQPFLSVLQKQKRPGFFSQLSGMLSFFSAADERAIFSNFNIKLSSVLSPPFFCCYERRTREILSRIHSQKLVTSGLL